MKRRGFTLLEVIVASSIMAIAVVGLLAAISTSMRGASRLTEYDRASLVAQRKMDELLANPLLRPGVRLEGALDQTQTGGLNGGWAAHTSIFEAPPQAAPGTPYLMRIGLQVWWQRGELKRTFDIEAFRRGILRRGDVPEAPAP
jgi:general secretion pathway protein I